MSTRLNNTRYSTVRDSDLWSHDWSVDHSHQSGPRLTNSPNPVFKRQIERAAGIIMNFGVLSPFAANLFGSTCARAELARFYLRSRKIWPSTSAIRRARITEGIPGRNFRPRELPAVLARADFVLLSVALLREQYYIALFATEIAELDRRFRDG